MGQTTSRLGLYLPGGGSTGLITPDEPADIDKINDNMSKIDAEAGVFLCTSSTRPSTPYNGKIIFETDTQETRIWSSSTSSWRIVGGSPVGTVINFAGSTAPSGWLIANGDAISRSGYPALFSVIGTTYGSGDGSTTFNIPDLRGRVPIGVDGGVNRVTSNNALGQSSGSQSHTLTVNEIPAHDHLTVASGRIWYDTGANLQNGSFHLGSLQTPRTGMTGGGQAHNNMQPYLVVNYLIKY